MQKIKNLIRWIQFSLKYLGDPPWDTGETPPEIKDHISGLEPGKALDIGCGTGTNVIYLGKQGWQVVGIDFIPRAIREARKKADGLNLDVEFHTMDVTQYFDLGQKFDFVYDIGCFHSLGFEKRSQYFDNLVRHMGMDSYYMVYGWLAESTDNRRGIREQDIHTLSEQLTCVDQTDTSERGRWASVWLKFKRETNDR